SGNALEQLLAYVLESGPHAQLIALDGSDEAPELSPTTSVTNLSGAYLFRAHSEMQSTRFQELLGGDSRVREVYRPPAYRARRAERPVVVAPRARTLTWSPDVAQKVAEAGSVLQWGLDRCGFPKVRRGLDQGGNAAPIVMIDNGSHLGHPQLSGAIRKYVAP